MSTEPPLPKSVEGCFFSAGQANPRVSRDGHKAPAGLDNAILAGFRCELQQETGLDPLKTHPVFLCRHSERPVNTEKSIKKDLAVKIDV